MAVHPLVDQLRFTRSEFMTAVRGVGDDDARRRLLPMNCLSWNVGHLAWQEQRYFLTYAQGTVLFPDIAEEFAYGAPGTTPQLSRVLEAWRAITAAADPWLDSLTSTDLQGYVMHRGKPTARMYGNLLQRVIYHYWYHTGENMAIRQQLGHTRLPQFVGNIEIGLRTARAADEPASGRDARTEPSFGREWEDLGGMPELSGPSHTMAHVTITNAVPSRIHADRQARTLSLDWPDGHRTVYDFTALRWLCPCAFCRGEAGMPGWLDSAPTLTDEQTRMVDIQLVGSYAVAPTWGDGHHTGYYTYEILRDRCPCDECTARRSATGQPATASGHLEHGAHETSKESA